MPELLNYLLALGVVFGLLGLVVWRFGEPRRLPSWLARRSAAGGEDASRVRLASAGFLRLTPHHTAHVVRAGSQAWVVACYPGGAVAIGELKLPDDHPPQTRPGGEPCGS